MICELRNCRVMKSTHITAYLAKGAVHSFAATKNDIGHRDQYAGTTVLSMAS
jgi:hypothetical protein